MESPSQGRDNSSLRAFSPGGLVLLDHAGRPLYFNTEAVRILTYPCHVTNASDLGKFLPRQIRCALKSRKSGEQVALTGEFHSHGRHYVCRMFPLSSGSRNPCVCTTAVLFERAAAKTSSVSAAAERFRLTEREQQTVTLLMDGLTSKEIAVRMNVTPNTVKTFVRLIMSKMAVSTRSGIVGKMFAA